MARKSNWERFLEEKALGKNMAEVDEVGMRERIRAIQDIKGTSTFSISFIVQFDKEWTAAVRRLKRAGFRR